MTKVVLVCGAGVSGTFLARRMRDLDPTLTVSVATPDILPAAARGSDLILVAPQLADSVDHIRIAVQAVPVIVLPGSAYGVGGADAAVRAVHEIASTPVAAPRTPSEEKV